MTLTEVAIICSVWAIAAGAYLYRPKKKGIKERKQKKPFEEVIYRKTGENRESTGKETEEDKERSEKKVVPVENALADEIKNIIDITLKEEF